MQMVCILEVVYIDIRYFKDKYESTLCYVGDDGNETKFFQLLNIFCWENHPVKKTDFLKGMYEKGPI